MPKRPPKNCTIPNCPNLTDNQGPCKQHRDAFNKQRYRRENKARKNDPHRKIYGLKKWKELRKRILSLNPLCEHCGEPAEEVDHITAVRARPDLAFNECNLQSLCSRCHKIKTAKEEGFAKNERQETA